MRSQNARGRAADERSLLAAAAMSAMRLAMKRVPYGGDVGAGEVRDLLRTSFRMLGEAFAPKSAGSTTGS